MAGRPGGGGDISAILVPCWPPLAATDPCEGVRQRHDSRHPDGRRLDHGELDGLAPRHVVLMIGTNNVLNGGDPVQIVEGIRACLIRIRAKVPHARIVLMGILPCRNPATHPHRLLAAKVNQELAKLAKTAKCDYLDLTPQFLDAQGNIPAALMDDAIHPTPAGYKIWSEALAPLLKADGAASRP